LANVRVGLGYDVHAFEATRPLVLGGVTISPHGGLAGWSDADVVIHAIVDALLGAAGLGDLGEHFTPDNVPEGFSGTLMLRQAAQLVAEAGYRVVNVDAVVVIQGVRVAPHRALMRSRIAGGLGIDQADVSVKATTTDHLGFAGRGEGAAGIAVALVERIERAG
jgi:2-C-methyl-D-erythritol 2,4-cyclodiphosphate synthase